jgi:nitroreductase
MVDNILYKMGARKSPKIFDGSEIDALNYHELVAICNLAPSSMGIQPVRMITIKSKKAKAELLKATYNQKQVESCSHLIALVVKNNILSKDIDDYIGNIAITRGQSKDSLNGFRNNIVDHLNRLDKREYDQWVSNQAYLVLGTLLTACAAKGIDACAMEGFNPSEYDRILGLKPKGYHTVVLCAIGNTSPEDPMKDEAKVRVPNSEFHLNQL